MITKNELKFFSSLLHKKYRNEYKKFLVEGLKLINEALDSGFVCEIIISTFLFAEKNVDIIQNFQKMNLRTEVLNQPQFEKLCDTTTPQGIIGVFKIPEVNQFSFKERILKEKIVVALENVSDPGNLGTILRNCDWFGIRKVLLSSDCAEVFNPKTIRASAGSVFHIETFESKNFYDDLIEMKKNNFEIICSDLVGLDVYDFKLKRNSVLLFCNEAHGPTNKLIEIVDQKVTIPSFGKAESLNVASASAIILSELTKSLRYKN